MGKGVRWHEINLGKSEVDKVKHVQRLLWWHAYQSFNKNIASHQRGCCTFTPILFHQLIALPRFIIKIAILANVFFFKKQAFNRALSFCTCTFFRVSWMSSDFESKKRLQWVCSLFREYSKLFSQIYGLMRVRCWIINCKDLFAVLKTISPFIHKRRASKLWLLSALFSLENSIHECNNQCKRSPVTVTPKQSMLM